MNSKIITVAIILAGCAMTHTLAAQTPTDNTTADNAATTPVLTLDQCISIALDANPTIHIADLDITRVDYTRKDALAQLLPTVSFGTTYNRMLAKQVAYMDFDMSSMMSGGTNTDDSSTTTPDDDSTASKSKNDDGIKMGRDNSWQLGFQASMPLIAPQLWATLKLTDSQIAQNVEQARASRLELVNQVNSAYYSLLLAKDSKEVIQQSYDMATLTYNIYSKRFSVGDASEYDVLRTSVAMKNVEPELLQADIAIRRATLQLRILLGMPADFEFDIAGRLSDYEDTMYADAMSLDRDYSNNSSLVMNTLEAQTLDRTLRVARMAWYPTLSLTASYNWTSSSNGNPFRSLRWSPYSIIGLTLNVPLFQGGSRLNKIKQTQVQIEQMRLTRENLERNVAMQVDLAIDNIGLNVRQIASNSQSMAQADRAHTIMEESFKIGSASYLELRDSELALTRSQLTYYQSIYNYLIARSELDLLLGKE